MAPYHIKDDVCYDYWAGQIESNESNNDGQIESNKSNNNENSFQNCNLGFNSNDSNITKIESNKLNQFYDVIQSSFDLIALNFNLEKVQMDCKVQMDDKVQTEGSLTDGIQTNELHQKTLIDDHLFQIGIVIEKNDNLYLKQEDNNGLFYNEVTIYTIISRILLLI